jgi:hypothetical protein
MLHRSSFSLAALALAGALAGCPVTPVSSTATASRAVLSGNVSVPASIISHNGGGIISHNGGGIISHNGGGLVGNSGGTYRTLAVTQAPVGGARVFLADATGAALPGLPAATTDDQGRFAIAGVPAGYTFVVAAEADTQDGQSATFQTLARSAAQDVKADIDAGSSLVAAAAIKNVQGRDLGGFDPTTFLDAARTMAQQLSDGQLPDFTSRSDVQARSSQLVAAVPALQQAVSALGKDLAVITQPFANLLPSAAPSPAPTAAPATPPPPAPTAAPATPRPAPSAPGACSPTQEHYLQPLLDGAPLPYGWALDIAYGTGATSAATDASGVARAWVPVGCELALTLHDPKSTATYAAKATITPGVADAHANPVKLAFSR